MAQRGSPGRPHGGISSTPKIDGSADADAASFGHPAAGQPASTGPATDCIVDKIREFTAELAAPTTALAERLLALKYLLHFVGDVHQPLHASDNHDRGGNCVLVSLGGSRTLNLHAYWDTAVVEAAVGKDVTAAATNLRARITPTQRVEWRGVDPPAWANEAFQVARSTVYKIGSPAGCQSDVAPIALPSRYEAAAQAAAHVQLQRAALRLAMVLNTALEAAVIAPSIGSPSNTSNAAPEDGMSRSAAPTGRSAASLACSADVDAKGLHGKERRRFRRSCIRNREDS